MAHKGKKKVSKAMGAILKTPKKAEKVVKAEPIRFQNLKSKLEIV